MSRWSGPSWPARVFLRTIAPPRGPRIISTWWRRYSVPAEPWRPAARAHHHSTSQVLDMALRRDIEGGAHLTVLATVYHQLSTHGAALGQQSQEVHQSVQTLTGLVQTLLTRVTALEERFTA